MGRKRCCRGNMGALCRGLMVATWGRSKDSTGEVQGIHRPQSDAVWDVKRALRIQIAEEKLKLLHYLGFSAFRA